MMKDAALIGREQNEEEICHLIILSLNLLVSCDDPAPYVVRKKNVLNMVLFLLKEF